MRVLISMLISMVFIFASASFADILSPISHNTWEIILQADIEKPIFGVRGDFTTIELSGKTGYSMEIGKPEFPVVRRFVRIPAQGDVHIEIDVHSTECILLSEMWLPTWIIPRQPPRSKRAKKFEFAIDEDWYRRSSHSVMPDNSVRLVPVGIIRGRRIAILEFSPIVQYDPRTGEIIYVKSAEIKIDFDEEMEQLAPRFHSVAFGEFLAGLLLVPEDISPMPELPIVFWAIYEDSFYDEIVPLLEWKKKMGYDVVETAISTIGASVYAVKDAVQTAYDTWAYPPDFVLFVGDVEQIPAEEIMGMWDSHFSDLYYFTTDGTDFLPDILYGRFSCATTTQVAALVQKTLFHERLLMSDTGFLRIPAFAACGTDGDYELAENTHRYVFETWTTPPEYFPESLWAYDGATGADVLAAINDGTFILNYSGHGGTDEWCNPEVTITDIYSLMNADKYPVIISNACLTGSFNLAECFGEAWIRAPEKGAVAFIGASNSTLWDEDDIWERRWFDAVFADSFSSISGATYKANLELMLWGTSEDQYYFEIYHNLSDPSLWLFCGELTPITVDLSMWDDCLPIGEDYYDIPVSEDGSLVSLWRDGDRIGCAMSEYGSARIYSEFTPTEPGSAWVVATKPNFFASYIQLVPNEHLCVAEYSPESLQVGIDNIFEITITSGDGIPYEDAIAMISGFGVTESTLTDASGFGTMSVNPPYEGIYTLTVDYDGRRILRRDIRSYGAASWEIINAEIDVASIMLVDTLALGFEALLTYSLSLNDFICFIKGAGLGTDSIEVVEDSLALNLTPTGIEPLVLSFAKPGYAIIADTIPVIVACGPFDGFVVDVSTGLPIETRPNIALLSDADTVAAFRAAWDGSFEYPGSFACDSYEVALSAFGYHDTTIQFLLTTMSGYTFQMEPIAPQSHISIDVSNSIGDPLCAEVQLLSLSIDEVVAVGKKLEPGQYDLGNQPYEGYLLVVRSRGYIPRRMTILPTSSETDIDIVMSASGADILIIDVSTDGESPAAIHDDLEEMGFSVELIAPMPGTYPDTAQMWQHNVVMHSAGINSFSATPSNLEELLMYHRGGGRLIFEGGEFAYQVIEEGGFDPIYGSGLLHLDEYLLDNPGEAGLGIGGIFEDSLVYSYPAFLPPNITTVDVGFWDYEQFDIVTPADDAEFFYTTIENPNEGCVVLFGDFNRRGWARGACCSFTYNEAFEDMEDAQMLFANTIEYMLPPEQACAVVFGEITRYGGAPGNIVEIQAYGPSSVVDTTQSDGRYAIATEPGEYILSLRRVDYRDTTISIELKEGAPLHLDVVLIPIEKVHDKTPDAVFVSAPYPNPFNNAVSVRFENPNMYQVHARVSDIAGRLIRNRELGNDSAGEFTFRPEQCPSGLYFITIAVGKQQFVRKIAYIR